MSVLGLMRIESASPDMIAGGKSECGSYLGRSYPALWIEMCSVAAAPFFPFLQT